MDTGDVLDILRRVGKGGTAPPIGGQSPRGASLADAAARAGAVRALLARALRRNELDDREGGRKSGRLDARTLARVPTGSVNLFTKRHISEGFDTDVAILVDASGSMGGRMHVAMEAALVIAQAAASVGVTWCGEVFNSGEIASFGNGRGRPVPGLFGAAIGKVGGGTPLSENIARVASAQAGRAPGKRRVVFLLTDGGCDRGSKSVRAIARYCEQTYGTVFAHVSIDTPCRGDFPAEITVRQGSAFADVGLAHFVRVLQAL